MSYSIALSGKGGSGKTTLAALTVKYLLSRGAAPVFAVDADPNSNLADQLGVEQYGTVGDIREELLAIKNDMPAGMAKADFIRYRIAETVTESRGFDLLNMGRPEGPGCYCYVNSLIRDYLDNRGTNYSAIVMDNEAGMEHLSRRTTRDVDLLLVVTDLTQVSLTAALRIGALARSLELAIRAIGVIVNRATEVPATVQELMRAADIEILGCVPPDPVVDAMARSGSPLLEVGEDSVAFRALAAILDGRGVAATAARAPAGAAVSRAAAHPATGA